MDNACLIEIEQFDRFDWCVWHSETWMYKIRSLPYCLFPCCFTCSNEGRAWDPPALLVPRPMSLGICALKGAVYDSNPIPFLSNSASCSSQSSSHPFSVCCPKSSGLVANQHIVSGACEGGSILIGSWVQIINNLLPESWTVSLSPTIQSAIFTSVG